MQKIKRLRVFAGPNGSGKTTLYESFSTRYDAGFFVNADHLEKQLKEVRLIDLSYFDVVATQEDLNSFKDSVEGQSLLNKAKDEGLIIDLSIRENFLVNGTKETNSYEASFAASFIRFLLNGLEKSYSFETVMSHPGKIEEMVSAKASGYRTYLYFVCTDDAFINISRVEKRVEKGGHAVESNKIVKRYKQTLNNLYAAVKATDRAYLFDNSGGEPQLIATVFTGKLTLLTDSPPIWFKEHLLPHYL